MSRRQLAVLIAVAAIVTLSTLVAAAPSLDVRKVPTGTVVPNPSWTGPPGDPHAVWGQWIKDKRTGIEEWYTHEFYDNAPGAGGGGMGTAAIRGIAKNIIYAGGVGSNMLAFDVDATILNDSPSAQQPWQAGANSHGESLVSQFSFAGMIYGVRLTAEFAVDPNYMPTAWTAPYTNTTPYIIATDHDYLAWYCWTPNNPLGKSPFGDYYVPAYYFPDIQPGGSFTRAMHFTISGAGLPNTDPRYDRIRQSATLPQDMFVGRTTDLKVGDWIDTVGLEGTVPYPGTPARSGDVSVFHNYGDEPRPRDWGDAPPQYPTLALSSGANHILWNGLYLGAAWDAENDGQPDPNAAGDDNNPPIGPDDEDGIFWTSPYFAGQVGATVNVMVTLPAGMNGAFLDAWIDFGRDGSWLSPGDQIAASLTVVAGVNLVAFNIPASAVPGQTFARFRLSSYGGLPPTGMATDGEVEDEGVQIEKMEQKFDFGDAPDGPYPTLLASDGARHLPIDLLCLGVLEDFEANGQPDANALGDDNNPPAGLDDEDGISWMPPYFAGQVGATVNVLVTMGAAVPAYLDAWIDFGGDGSWLTPGDQIANTLPVVNGVNLVTFNVPLGARPGRTFARFRLSTKGGLQPTGMASDGEVEDEVVAIDEWHGEYDFGDAPEGALAYPASGVMGMFPTCMQVGPASFVQHSNFGGWFGQMVDFEPDGNAGLCPLFSPGSYDKDECYQDGDAGLLFPPSYTISGTTVVPCTGITGPLGYTCQPATWGTNTDIHIHNWMPNHEPYVIAYVNVLMDWDQNGMWGGASQCPTAAAPEHVLVDFPIPAKYDGPLSALNPPGFLIGPNAGHVWTRFSITERPVGKSWDGSGIFEDGESEDYLLLVEEQERLDWGDAPDGPYPTLAASNGANHVILQGFMLGNLIDAEPDGQPNANATGDDIANLPDEDGVPVWPPLVPGQAATVIVNASLPAGLPAFLDAWIDFGNDGSWATPGDQVAFAMPVVVGPSPVTFLVPRTGNPLGYPTFARFRLHTSPNGLPFTGPWSDGEVEDYFVKINPDHGSLTFNRSLIIKDHFWWRSDPDPFNEMLSLKVSNDLVEPVSWDSVTLSLSGGLPGDVAQIDVWQDVDANGVVDPTIDILLGTAVNPVSPIAIALTSPIIPANSSISALVSYKLVPGAAIGNVYSLQVTGATGTGQISGLPADIFGLPISSCRKTVVPPPISIGQAKLAHVEPGGTLVFLQGKLCTAVFAPWNLFYMEERDRSAGIGVQFTGLAPVSQDEIVSVYGRTQLLNSAELIIVLISIEAGPTLLPKITPVGMNNKWTGGGRFGGQPAVFDDAPAGVRASGLSNVGMLVRTWGLVVWHDAAFFAPTVSGPFFWINDGSNLDDGLRIGSLVPSGVACYYGFCGHPGSFPDIGKYWGVTGILRAIPSSTLGQPPVRLLVPRSFPEDLNDYPITTTP